ncbi:MAG: class I SAM-dependent methyltransferase [Anaerolinea sp.]|nr:class I SAM-dependent methyltransferase [Anaerolinea sp.]
MRWTTKAHIQRILSSTPGGKWLYYHVGQRIFGGLRNFQIEEKLREGRTLLERLYTVGEHIQDRNTVEIGSGWVPVVPMFYWLHGQRSCITLDVSRLLKPALVLDAAKQLSTLSPSLLALSNTSNQTSLVEKQAELRSRIDNEQSVNTLLKYCQIDYRAPVNTSRTELPSESVEAVYSNTVLEHVPLPTLETLIAEMHRILRPGGITFHLINPADHFSYSDSSISTINFLRFSERDFAKYNSDFIFQNRLRPFQYRKLFEKQGFTVQLMEVIGNPTALQRFPRHNLHHDFAGLDDSELSAHDVYLVAKRV